MATVNDLISDLQTQVRLGRGDKDVLNEQNYHIEGVEYGDGKDGDPEGVILLTGELAQAEEEPDDESEDPHESQN